MVSRFTIEVSGASSKVIQEWIKEVNLHGGTGKLLSVGKACELVIEDFATVMRSVDDEGELSQEAKELIDSRITDVEEGRVIFTEQLKKNLKGDETMTTIDMIEGICPGCKKKTFIAPRGICMECVLKELKL